MAEVYRRFPDGRSCINHLEKVFWKGKPVCPYCKSEKATRLRNERRYHCNTCNTSFSVTVGTIFQKTKIDYQKWFAAITLIMNTNEYISARRFSRILNINKNTARYLVFRIRKCLREYPDGLERLTQNAGVSKKTGACPKEDLR